MAQCGTCNGSGEVVVKVGGETWTKSCSDCLGTGTVND